ncbi:hypothetical protein AB0M94_35420 [Streptomyces xanthochromogenes]|uniref:hypothetical protein n=1 Tax=Streptomyces xanthochromogenes TaxID=67384 RepID=UPI0034168BA8
MNIRALAVLFRHHRARHGQTVGSDTGEATTEQLLMGVALIVTAGVLSLVLPQIPFIKTLFGI